MQSDQEEGQGHGDLRQSEAQAEAGIRQSDGRGLFFRNEPRFFNSANAVDGDGFMKKFRKIFAFPLVKPARLSYNKDGAGF